MTLIQLRYLVGIVDAGLNMTRAAGQLGATQPGLSQQLKQIEEELGFQLFVRRGRSLERLSEPGEAIVERARAILVETANIRTLAAEHRRTALGQLRIATTHTQASFVLPRPLAALRARFPDLRLVLAQVGEDEALQRIEQGAADIAFVSGAERPPGGALAIPIYRWNLVAIARSDDPPPASGRPLGLAELAAIPLVTYESFLQPRASFSRAFADSGLVANVACTAQDSELIKTYVRARMGVGVIAEMAAGPDEADLRRLDIDGLFATRTTWAVISRDRLLRGLAQDLIAAMAPHLRRDDIRRANDSGSEIDWPSPPHWREIADGSSAPLGRLPISSVHSSKGRGEGAA